LETSKIPEVGLSSLWTGCGNGSLSISELSFRLKGKAFSIVLK
jgi:hypothetical protein